MTGLWVLGARAFCIVDIYDRVWGGFSNDIDDGWLVL